MKKLKYIFILTVFLALSLLFFAGCNENTVGLSKIEITKQPEVAKYEVGAFCYEDYEIKATNTDGTYKVFTLCPDYLSDYDKMQITQVGVHTVTIDFRGLKQTFTVEIVEKSMAEEGAIAPYMDSLTVTYDGAPHTLSVQGDLPSNATVRYENGPTFTNAGTYTVVAVITAENYKTIRLTATLTINKADYDMSNVIFAPDYGTDDEGNAKSAFIYDGLEHSVVVKGTYPEELTLRYEIGTRANDQSTFKEGNSATDSSMYFVRAIFSGDTINHTTNGLVLQATMYIDKKPIDRDFLLDLELGTKVVTYNGQAHRLYFENLTLPEGIRVEYLDEDGNLFGSRVNANEEGYLVYPHFINDLDPNSDITSDIVGKLIIKRAVLAGGTDVSVTFENGLTEQIYNNTAFGFVANNLPNILKVDHYEIDGEIVTGVTEAGTYDVTVYYQELSNYLPVAPLTTTLVVNTLGYTAIQDNFPENATYSYTPDSPLSYSYNLTSIPAGMTAKVSYVDYLGEEHNGLPQNITEVGTYTCHVQYLYKESNYNSLPDNIGEIRESVITIIPRVYDASSIKTPDSVHDYDGVTDWATTLSFTEQIPDWVTYKGVEIQNVLGTTVATAKRVAEYNYFFVFEYFDGEKTATAKSGAGFLKVTGTPINEEYFTIHYQSASAYDGSAHLPTVSFNFPDADISNPFFLISNYKFYNFIDGNEQIIAEQDREETSKMAGTHTITLKICAENYEPYIIEFSLVVERKTITVNYENYHINAKSEFVYDGQNHSTQIAVISSDGELDNVKMSIVDRFPKDHDGKIAGVDVGKYFYNVEFTNDNPNYLLDVDGNFTYEVEIKPFSITLDKLFAIKLGEKTLTADLLGNYTNAYSTKGITFLPLFTSANSTADEVKVADYINNHYFSYTLTDSKNVVVANGNTAEDLANIVNATKNAGTYTLSVKLADDNILINSAKEWSFTYTVSPIEVKADTLVFESYDTDASAYQTVKPVTGGLSVPYVYGKILKVTVNTGMTSTLSQEDAETVNSILSSCVVTITKNGNTVCTDTVANASLWQTDGSAGTYLVTFTPDANVIGTGNIYFDSDSFTVTVTPKSLVVDEITLKNATGTETISLTATGTFTFAGAKLSAGTLNSFASFAGKNMYCFEYYYHPGFFTTLFAGEENATIFSQMPYGVPLAGVDANGNRIKNGPNIALFYQKTGATFAQNLSENGDGNGAGNYYFFYTLDESYCVDGANQFVVKISIKNTNMDLSTKIVSNNPTALPVLKTTVGNAIMLAHAQTELTNLTDNALYAECDGAPLYLYDIDYANVPANFTFTIDLSGEAALYNTTVSATFSANKMTATTELLGSALSSTNAVSVANNVITVKIGEGNDFTKYSGFYFIKVDSGIDALLFNGSKTALILVRVNPDTTALNTAKQFVNSKLTDKSYYTEWADTLTYTIPDDYLDLSAYGDFTIDGSWTMSSKTSTRNMDGITITYNFTDVARFGENATASGLRVILFVEPHKITPNKSNTTNLPTIYYYGEDIETYTDRVTKMLYENNTWGIKSQLEGITSLDPYQFFSIRLYSNFDAIDELTYVPNQQTILAELVLAVKPDYDELIDVDMGYGSNRLGTYYSDGATGAIGMLGRGYNEQDSAIVYINVVGGTINLNTHDGASRTFYVDVCPTLTKQNIYNNYSVLVDNTKTFEPVIAECFYTNWSSFTVEKQNSDSTWSAYTSETAVGGTYQITWKVQMPDASHFGTYNTPKIAYNGNTYSTGSVNIALSLSVIAPTIKLNSLANSATITRKGSAYYNQIILESFPFSEVKTYGNLSAISGGVNVTAVEYYSQSSKSWVTYNLPKPTTTGMYHYTVTFNYQTLSNNGKYNVIMADGNTYVQGSSPTSVTLTITVNYTN